MYPQVSCRPPGCGGLLHVYQFICSLPVFRSLRLITQLLMNSLVSYFAHAYQYIVGLARDRLPFRRLPQPRLSRLASRPLPMSSRAPKRYFDFYPVQYGTGQYVQLVRYVHIYSMYNMYNM